MGPNELMHWPKGRSTLWVRLQSLKWMRVLRTCNSSFLPAKASLYFASYWQLIWHNTVYLSFFFNIKLTHLSSIFSTTCPELFQHQFLFIHSVLGRFQSWSSRHCWSVACIVSFSLILAWSPASCHLSAGFSLIFTSCNCRYLQNLSSSPHSQIVHVPALCFIMLTILGIWLSH